MTDQELSPGQRLRGTIANLAASVGRGLGAVDRGVGGLVDYGINTAYQAITNSPDQLIKNWSGGASVMLPPPGVVQAAQAIPPSAHQPEVVPASQQIAAAPEPQPATQPRRMPTRREAMQQMLPVILKMPPKHQQRALQVTNALLDTYLPSEPLVAEPVLDQSGKPTGYARIGDKIEKMEAGKPDVLNADQTNALTFAARMANAENDIANVMQSYDATSIASGLPVPERLKSDPRKSFETARDTYVAALLRKESGASISDQERETFGRIYLPQPGDGPDVVEQKRRMREVALRSMLAGVPNGAQRLQEAIGGTSAPQTQQGGSRRVTYTPERIAK